MKNCAIFIILLGLLMSCTEKPDDTCGYTDDTLIDTTLFVTFKINGQEMKFYQFEPLNIYGWSSESAPIIKDENTYICCFNYQIDFVSYTEEDMGESFSAPEFALYFSKKVVANKKAVNAPNLYDVFSNISGFSNYLPDLPKLKDTLYMDGVIISLLKLDSSINIWNPPSTSNAFEYYNLNQDSIDSFFKNSFIAVSNVEEICNNIYLIEGTFRAKLMYPVYDNETPKVLELTDGKFKFIRHQ